jgi:tetratricopeptide (TPR) repeat protein
LTVVEHAVALGQTERTAFRKTYAEAIVAVAEKRVSQSPAGNQQQSAADVEFSKEMKLYKQGTVESLRTAIAKFEEAARLYSVGGDREQQSVSLIWSGFISDVLGEKQKALVYYNQALPLQRAVDDRRGEANNLHGIGVVYNVLGQKQEALSYFNQALSLYKAVGNRLGILL